MGPVPQEYAAMGQRHATPVCVSGVMKIVLEFSGRKRRLGHPGMQRIGRLAAEHLESLFVLEFLVVCPGNRRETSATDRTPMIRGGAETGQRQTGIRDNIPRISTIINKYLELEQFA